MLIRIDDALINMAHIISVSAETDNDGKSSATEENTVVVFRGSHVARVMKFHFATAAMAKHVISEIYNGFTSCKSFLVLSTHKTE